MQTYTNLSRHLLSFSKPPSWQRSSWGTFLERTYRCLAELHSRQVTVKRILTVKDNNILPLVSVLSHHTSSCVQTDKRNLRSNPELQSHGFTSVSLKEKPWKPLKQRRQDPIKVAHQVFGELKERHPSQLRPQSRINVNMLGAEMNQDTNFSKINSESFRNTSSIDLLKMLQKIHLSDKSNLQEYKKTISGIENVLRKRIEADGLSLSLDIADVFFIMGANCRAYISAMFDYITKRFDILQLKPSWLTRLMFYVFLHGSAPPLLYPKIEEFLCNHLDEFHIKDISVVCLGFFRSMHRIDSTELLEKMADRLLMDIEQVGQHGLVNILKAFRHSGYNNVSFFENLADALIKNQILENCLNLNLLMHIASTYAGLSVFHSELLDIILKQFINVLDKHDNSQIRSKDLAKFVWAFGVFVFEPEKHRDLYMKLVSAYRDKVSKEDVVYPESLADMLQGLMYLQIFPDDLIAKMFDIDTATALRDDAVMRKAIQVLMIHNAVIIECPHYSGPTLPQSFVDTLSKIDEVKKSLDFELSMRRGLAKVRNTLKEMYGEDRVHTHFILSHFRSADIELRFSRSREAIPFEPQEFNSKWRFDDKNRETRVVIEVAGLNQFCTKSSRMKGNYDTKLRQLRLLGYNVILITPHECENFRKMTVEERQEYLLKCLRDIVE